MQGNLNVDGAIGTFDDLDLIDVLGQYTIEGCSGFAQRNGCIVFSHGR
jgi:hypothetical protein